VHLRVGEVRRVLYTAVKEVAAEEGDEVGAAEPAAAAGVEEMDGIARSEVPSWRS
jgi:hypothetical protein